MYIDSSEWVMVPNVFGMATYSDGGIMSTKPYTCGSNYILNMSNYKRGDWCEIMDGLYWRFTEKNIKFYESNPRLSILVRNLYNMDIERKERIFVKAEQFIKNNTLWKKKKFVEHARCHLIGEKNGRETGTKFCIVVKDVEGIKSN